MECGEHVLESWRTKHSRILDSGDILSVDTLYSELMPVKRDITSAGLCLCLYLCMMDVPANT